MKGDLTVFISQPVTRLAQLNLILEQALKYTPEGRSPYLLQYSNGRSSHNVGTDHTDHETISLILGILSWIAKSTVPGVQAAEDKVKVFTLGESLVFRETELIASPLTRRRSDLKSFVSQDLDFDSETRTVVHEGTVGQLERDDGPSRVQWIDSGVKLLDHYCACVPIRPF